jgi:acyl-homoserine lactone acylase PvdQ
MKYLPLILILFFPFSSSAQVFREQEIARWTARAQQVTIIRDKWGVPHIYGKTDADAVFGLLYAQCEDDFARVEQNYIEAIGRLAEVEGESAVYHDIRARLFLDTLEAIRLYEKSPEWMKHLLDAFADGANYYLHTHPQVKPRLLSRFQPWMPLMFSEGSIGGDIGTVPLSGIQSFYGTESPGSAMLEKHNIPEWEREPTGSNGFAIAPSKSASGNALLLINPHTSFYFRGEVHIVSEEGLNAYGAVTWGQFFIYQGFNENCGWMHTSSSADAMDDYFETVVQQEGKWYYRYGKKLRAVQSRQVVQPYKDGDGSGQKAFTLFWTHHGPVVGVRDGKWVVRKMMNTPLEALMQSYLRTKADGYKGFQKVMALRTNSSNNTVFADRQGNIAYWHGNFIPRRNPAFDWSRPVDGSNPATEWKGLHNVKEIVQVKNPSTGWLQNCNSTPFTAAAAASPKPSDFPAYMAPDPENFRGLNAVRVLARGERYTLSSLIEAAYDPHLAAFEPLIPSLLAAHEAALAQQDTLAIVLRDPVAVLRAWDYTCGVTSIATTLAILWAEKLTALVRTRLQPGQAADIISMNTLMINATSGAEKLQILAQTIQELETRFGTWKTSWGELNRFQRLTGKIQETYDDRLPSLPVGFTPSVWGSLAAFGARPGSNTKKRYGYVGNSFVAVVEFGPTLKARSILAGGQSSDPASPHFRDQAEWYAQERFKDVLFYREDVEKNAERTYRPGQ